jgi:hypothetical protein
MDNHAAELHALLVRQGDLLSSVLAAYVAAARHSKSPLAGEHLARAERAREDQLAIATRAGEIYVALRNRP